MRPARSWPSSARVSTRSVGNCSTGSPVALRRSATAVSGSAPGARPIPRSMRPGWRASSIANCSPTTRAGWLGSMTPPDPTRMRSVRAARCAIRTAGEVEATAGIEWCSATQNLAYPSSSARRASAVVAARASWLVPPSLTVARSRTESGTRGVVTPGQRTGPLDPSRAVDSTFPRPFRRPIPHPCTSGAYHRRVRDVPVAGQGYRPRIWCAWATRRTLMTRAASRSDRPSARATSDTVA
ncbi:hypothetical protein GALL_553430 [mine drainage metagenome]|uniref:Uncharacterized protein n=1 Tax=mine drainage metagenome TaxID=410659 RepID=A0A1J5P5N0_9ZZZZ